MSSWTITSQTINLSLDVKKDIVLDLQTLPVVLDELETSKELTTSLNKIIGLYEIQLKAKDTIILNKDIQLNALKNQTKLFKKQLTKERLKIGGVALLVITTLILVR